VTSKSDNKKIAQKMDDSRKKFIWFFGIIEGYRRLSMPARLKMCLKNKGQMTKY
jgi:hypothetical protein